MAEDKYFVFYVTFDGSKVPIFCKEVKEDPYIKEHFLYSGVEKLSDSVFPELVVNSISLPKEDVIYYVSGTKEEVQEAIKEEPKEKPKEEIIAKKEEEKIEEPPKKKQRKRRSFADV